MIATITAGLISAALSILGKLATQTFFEAVLTKIVTHSLDKLSKMTTNTLDDELAAEVKKRLE
jgi:hypothetical protein